MEGSESNANRPRPLRALIWAVVAAVAVGAGLLSDSLNLWDRVSGANSSSAQSSSDSLTPSTDSPAPPSTLPSSTTRPVPSTTWTTPPSSSPTQFVDAKYLRQLEVNTSLSECDNSGLGVGWSTFIDPDVLGHSEPDAIWVTPDWKSGVMACGEFALGGQYTKLSGYVGVNDKFPAGSVARLTILGDGRPLATLTPALGQRIPLDVGVSGVNVLRISAQLLQSSMTSSLDNIAIVGRLS